MAITYTTISGADMEVVKYLRLLEIERGLYRRELDELYLTGEIAVMPNGQEKTDAEARLADLSKSLADMERLRDVVKVSAPAVDPRTP